MCGSCALGQEPSSFGGGSAAASSSAKPRGLDASAARDCFRSHLGTQGCGLYYTGLQPQGCHAGLQTLLHGVAGARSHNLMSPSEEAEKQSPVLASSASERVASECALHCARCRCCRKSKMTISPFCPPPGGSPWLTRKWKRQAPRFPLLPRLASKWRRRPSRAQRAALSMWMCLWSAV